MAIITAAEVKSLLQISISTYDSLLASLIPIVQNKICEYCNNYFLSNDIWISSSGISFTAKSGETAAYISDSESGFVDALFISGIDIHASGSYFNDGIYHADTVIANKLTLATTDTLYTEDEDVFVKISQVVWPKGIKIDVANYIGFLLIKQKGVKSESLPDYSVTYSTEQEALAKFNQYRRLRK